MAQSSVDLSWSPNLSVEVASGDDLDVRTFHVRENVQQPFEVDLELTSKSADVDLMGIVGKEATFRLRFGAGGERTWTGLATLARQSGVDPDGLSTYQIVIRPLLWALTQRRNHRIFQAMSEPAIAIQILREWGIAARVDLDVSAYKARKYRVQYAESDFAFWSRMLEDAGISYHYDSIDGATTLVLSDALEAAEPRGAAIDYVNAPNAKLSRDWVSRVALEHGVAPARYIQRDVDYRRAPSFPLLAEAEASATGLLSRAEHFHYVPGAFLFAASDGDPTPSADDRGRHRTDLQEAQKLVQKRLDAKRGGARRVTFETSARDVRPGCVICIAGYPRAELGEGVRLLVVSSSLSGTSTSEWSQSVEARFADIPFRPELTTPKPRVCGLESATVVGPDGDDIHTDEFGRVRVHFHWDREGKWNEQDSCWIPVSQPWGGSGFGAMNLPRVGQEVLVEFLGGNPDGPVIVGRVYTNLQKVPYALPAARTQSGWKSFSSPSTGGYNEIMFEDAAGSELLRVQAERDRATVVKNDCSTTVGRNEAKRVQNDRSLSVANDDSTVIERDRSESVRRNRAVQVDGDSLHAVGNDDVASVARHRYEWNGGDRRMESGGKFVAKIGNSSSYLVMSEGFIILQADKVFINPGEEATKLAIEKGIAPQTADEEAAAAAAEQAAAEEAENERNGELADAALNANRANAEAEADGLEAGYEFREPYMEAAEHGDSRVERAYNAVVLQFMNEGPATIGDGTYAQTREGLIRGDYGEPLSEAEADEVLGLVVTNWGEP